MPSPNQTKVFITHSWKDMELARQLYNALKAQGFEIWFDDSTLQAGHRLAEQINRGLEWCDVYIPIISQSALDSKWCWEEINAAIALSNHPRRNDRPRIIPVLAEDCELPALLSARLYINFARRFDDAVQELLMRGFGLRRTPIAFPDPIFVPVSAGDFLMGTSDADMEQLLKMNKTQIEQGYFRREQPQHRVAVDEFQIAKYPVTNAQYQAFVRATKRQPPKHWSDRAVPEEYAAHPVVNVTWEDAKVYCEWLTQQLRAANQLTENEIIRLPTEVEWEKAAAWEGDKGTKRCWPWGNIWDAAKCNTEESGYRMTTPVGKFSPAGDSFYGAADMAGNVWEWCADWYAEDYFNKSPDNNPTRPTLAQTRTHRGGSFNTYWLNTRCAYRGGRVPQAASDGTGFRVAKSFLPVVGAIS